MRIGESIHYKVHPTPMKPGDTQQTYHVRQVLKTTMRTRDLAEHIAKHSMLTDGLFEMFMDYLKRELAEQLLEGRDIHLDGIGRFSLQLGTKMVQDDDGQWHRKVYLHPDELTASEIVIEGISFVPDKQMLDRLHRNKRIFVHHKEGYTQSIPRDHLLTTLADFCQQHGSFTRNDFQELFGVSRYRAQQELDALVNDPSTKYCRVKQGSSYVYRKTDA